MTAIPQRSYKAGSDIDNCQTPPEAVALIVPYLKQIKARIIWEPAPGEYILAEALRASGFEVVTTESDFLILEPDFEFDAIVTNPPFAQDYAFAGRCMFLGKPWALLMKTDREGVSRFRAETFRNGSPIYQKIIPQSRISYKMPKAGWGEWKVKDGKRFKAGTAQFHTSWYTYGLKLPAHVMETKYSQRERIGHDDAPIGDKHGPDESLPALQCSL